MNKFMISLVLLLLLVIGTSRPNPIQSASQAEAHANSEVSNFATNPAPLVEEALLKMMVKALLNERNDEDVGQLEELLSNDKQLGNLFGGNNDNNGLFGNGPFGNFWNLITKRNKRRKIQNFLRQKGNLFLHAASIGGSVAALATAISVSSAAAHKVHNHNHEVVFDEDFTLEPYRHHQRSTDED